MRRDNSEREQAEYREKKGYRDEYADTGELRTGISVRVENIYLG